VVVLAVQNSHGTDESSGVCVCVGFEWTVKQRWSSRVISIIYCDKRLPRWMFLCMCVCFYVCCSELQLAIVWFYIRVWWLRTSVDMCQCMWLFS